jgi:hypothetical protein
LIWVSYIGAVVVLKLGEYGSDLRIQNLDIMIKKIGVE